MISKKAMRNQQSHDRHPLKITRPCRGVHVG